ncbi:ergothioneine biosynthesis protein EgtC [Nocardia jejuensis]|uniref:ergothioneine biosynthesis protein EgtC n=1 Tax=Nocardia jejuensis TaxID=328049 RepID=UPI000829F129|nr:ergothioneine biosynthesis protein EgtC [Nocardia jejuensis]
MCRHLAYLGPPAPVGDLLTRGPHSLRTQSWAPRDMRGGGTINADGFGVAWWSLSSESPVLSRYRNAAPVWTDPAVEEVLPQLHSSAVLAAVRSATVGMPVEREACAPFVHGRWAFSHNGSIPRWRRTLTAVASRFGSPPLLDAEALTDSAVLWVIARELLDAGESPENVLRQLVRAVIELSPNSRLNLLLGDGESVWATTWHHSLSVLVTDTFAVVASEPYDDDSRWRAIEDRRLVSVRPGHLTVLDLDAVIEEGKAFS